MIGLAVAVLSATGVYLWVKARQSRLKQKLTIKNKFSNHYGKPAIKKQL